MTSPFQTYMRGLAVLQPNRWHQSKDARGRPHLGHWMCRDWDVTRQRNGWWVAQYLYRARPPVESEEFATAEAAMHAVDVWCSRQWC